MTPVIEIQYNIGIRNSSQGFPGGGILRGGHFLYFANSGDYVGGIRPGAGRDLLPPQEDSINIHNIDDTLTDRTGSGYRGSPVSDRSRP